jgi:ABC-type polysaccharide/polyol phosphate transport system ATPase subunit
MNLLTGSKIMASNPPAESSDQTIIQLENASVRYRVPQEQIGTFKEYVIRILEGKVKQRTFNALHQVNLSINRGEVFGLIGHNGAGKSTLLKLVARVIRPTTGRVLVKGHVAPLLEVGAGFHPELTGRENVYLNGAMLGFSREEMQEKFSRIVEFSELGDFIDAPLRTYSTGMTARLGFAVATDSQPDILIVDEILSVGDEAFQHKSYERILSIKAQGATILLVSHSMGMIESICQRAAWLHRGEIISFGNSKVVIDQYLGRVSDEENRQLIEDSHRGDYLASRESRLVEIRQVRLLNNQNHEQQIFHTGESMAVQVEYVAHEPINSLEVGLAIHRQDGIHITGPNTAFDGIDIQIQPGTGGVTYTIPSIPLMEGLYQLSVSLVNRNGNIMLDYHDHLYTFRISNRGHPVRERYGLMTLGGEWRLLQ